MERLNKAQAFTGGLSVIPHSAGGSMTKSETSRDILFRGTPTEAAKYICPHCLRERRLAKGGLTIPTELANVKDGIGKIDKHMSECPHKPSDDEEDSTGISSNGQFRVAAFVKYLKENKLADATEPDTSTGTSKKRKADEMAAVEVGQKKKKRKKLKTFIVYKNVIPAGWALVESTGGN